MSVWFTSDLHLGHRFVSSLRGFVSVEDHDAAITDNWNALVQPKDQIWLLGDLTLSNPTRALAVIADLPGTKHFIAGNHDACHPNHRESHKWQAKFLEVFDSVQPFARRKVAGQDVLLSHFPYAADHTETARYTQWRLRDEGAWLLHGHTHTAVKQRGKELHVGVDAWNFGPVSLDTIADMILAADRG